MEKEKVMNLLDEFIKRAERNISDANARNDYDDKVQYLGEHKVVNEIKSIISKW